MKDTRLLDRFNDIKQILCQYDYYIHTSKKILHLTNGELKIPHLMGLQYIARPGMFEGDRGVYMIKSGKLHYDSIDKLIQKYYKREAKQNSMISMVHGKIDNLPQIQKMFASESVLYLYDIAENPESELKTDYLLVNQLEDRVLQLGLVKSVNSKEKLYHCNSFMVDFKKNEDYDLHYRNLSHCYVINKIVQEEKGKKRARVIYQSKEAESREKNGIAKMLKVSEINADEKLIKFILRLNKKFGVYHTMEMLDNKENLFAKCTDKREKALVSEFINLWNKKETSRPLE